MDNNLPRRRRTPSFSEDAVAKGIKALRTSKGCVHHAAPSKTAAASVQTLVKERAGLHRKERKKRDELEY